MHWSRHVRLTAAAAPVSHNQCGRDACGQDVREVHIRISDEGRGWHIFGGSQCILRMDCLIGTDTPVLTTTGALSGLRTLSEHSTLHLPGV